jgi:AcrR family transcriptional regulator
MSGNGRASSGWAAALESVTPSGSGQGPERVAVIQRARMIAAMADVTFERGAPNVTVAHLVARAGVSRRTFYELFDDCDDCFVAAFDEAVARASDYVLPAFQAGGSWRERIRSSLAGFLSFLDDDPSMGRLLVVESLGAGARALERRSRVLARVVEAIDEGRSASKAGVAPLLPSLTAEAVVGGVLSVIHPRLPGPDPGPLTELTGPLMSLIVLPYLGRAAARREIDLPVPRPHRRVRAVGPDPLRELDMRLTYRTVRVLMAVASHPGESNRHLADGAGISDQGQISKLLVRLERLGLIENMGAGSARGAPNAWVLTAQGWEVQGAISRPMGAERHAFGNSTLPGP